MDPAADPGKGGAVYAQRCFACLWDAFALLAPRAGRLRAVLAAAGYEAPVDHVGLRTVAAPPIGIRELERHLLAMDYRRCSQARDPERGLAAASWRGAEAHLPRIGIVEYDLHRLGPTAQTQLERSLEAIDPQRVLAADLLWGGRPWPEPRYRDYVDLLRDDPALAWILAIGLRPCHIALQLDHGLSLERVIAIAADAGIPMARRQVAGIPIALSDADVLPVEFADGRIHRLATARVAVVDPRRSHPLLALQLPTLLAERPAVLRGGHGD